ncbi:MAG: EF-Tu/IF-2/RF-3 family GTPase, partial [Bacilli bacterium]
TDDQLDFKVAFASATHGTSSLSSDITTQVETMNPILDLIVSEIPAPSVEREGYLQFQGALLDYNEYVGRMAIGRIKRGTIKTNTIVSCMRTDGSLKSFRIQKLYSFLGLHRTEILEAYAGDIVAVAGLVDINVGETICEVGYEEALPPIKISEPTVEMYFSVNNSPFAGKEGKFVTSTKLEERLLRETQKDVSLRVNRSGYHDEWIVSGRGELHLGILIENMRREGYEFQVAKPKPIIKEIEGKKCEPFEFVQIDLPNEYTGSTIELIGRLGGILESMTNDISQTRLIYTMPSRGLIGLTTDFMTCTKGYGTMSHIFLDYRPLESGLVGNRKLGVLVATNEGKTTAYGIGQIEDRGVLFVEPNENVYEGQIVGECNKEDDLAVNVIKAKQQTNQRSSSKDTTVVLKRPRIMPLEVCMEYINDDELVEITPKNIRLRKKILNTNQRKKFDSRKEG